MKRKTIFLLLFVSFLTLFSGCSVKEERKAQSREETPVIRVGSLKGPTSMGLVRLMDLNEQAQSENQYRFTMETDASALLPLMIKGELDIALLPANVAAVLCQKMKGELKVLNINTGSVLYLLSGDDSVTNIKDLKGKTIYLTGKGTTPDYVFSHLLEQSELGTGDVTLEYKSEPAEVAALLAAQQGTYGLLPQPFATAACIQNPDLSVRLDLGEAWENAGENHALVTGVTVVRKEFLTEQKEAVEIFLKEQKASAGYANENISDAAKLVVKYGILNKEPVAERAIPKCGITCITGAEMKEALSSYLEVLYRFNPEAVGGRLPGDEFYYEAES